MAEKGERLPQVKTQQGFMDVLEDMILPPRSDPENASSGRLRELKSYVTVHVVPEFSPLGEFF